MLRRASSESGHGGWNPRRRAAARKRRRCMEGPRQGIRPRLLTAVTATATAGAIGAGYGAFIVSPLHRPARPGHEPAARAGLLVVRVIPPSVRTKTLHSERTVVFRRPPHRHRARRVHGAGGRHDPWTLIGSPAPPSFESLVTALINKLPPGRRWLFGAKEHGEGESGSAWVIGHRAKIMSAANPPIKMKFGFFLGGSAAGCSEESTNSSCSASCGADSSVPRSLRQVVCRQQPPLSPRGCRHGRSCGRWRFHGRDRRR